MKIKIILGMLIIFLSACRPANEEITAISADYSIADVTSFMVNLECADADITELNDDFVKNYCAMLKQEINGHIQTNHAHWQLVEQNSDLVIEATLEQLYGGNQSLRFFLPLEAGRTMLTLHFSIYKQGLLIAERRVTEITRRIHFEDKKYTNEDAIGEDTKIVASYVSDYLDNPKQFDANLAKYRNGYKSH